MKQLVVFSLALLCHHLAFGQSADQLIRDIQTAQSRLTAVSYTLQRTDTFVTGQTRIITGQTIMRPQAQDGAFGFLFWSKRDSIARETIYDGRLAYEVNNQTKTYKITTNPKDLPHLLGTPGGQVVFGQLARLDTTGAMQISTSADKDFYYLTLLYPDITEYDVRKRTTTLWIDKKLRLPLRMRQRQETLDKVQDLYYEVTSLQLNKEAKTYDLDEKPFLTTHQQELPRPNRELLALQDKDAPPFELTSFANVPVSSSQFRGKVVLLDFWEVWCGPCIASMPKVEALYEKYRDKGLLVYGITCEKEQLASARKMVQKRGMTLPMLVGGEALQKRYSVNAVPLYVLINKRGKISYLGAGYSGEIEGAIQKALAE